MRQCLFFKLEISLNSIEKINNVDSYNNTLNKTIIYCKHTFHCTWKIDMDSGLW